MVGTAWARAWGIKPRKATAVNNSPANTSGRLRLDRFIESPLVIEIFTDDNRLYVRNNLQRYRVVETSNKQGLLSLKNLYSFYTDVPIDIEESAQHFTISIPLL